MGTAAMAKRFPRVMPPISRSKDGQNRAKETIMNTLKWLGTTASAALLATALALPAAAQAGKATLHDKSGKDSGRSISPRPRPESCSSFPSKDCRRASTRSISTPSASANHRPSSRRARTSIPPTQSMACCRAMAHAGDMPNLHVPPSGELSVEILNAAITLEKGKPNSVFHPGGPRSWCMKAWTTTRATPPAMPAPASLAA